MGPARPPTRVRCVGRGVAAQPRRRRRARPACGGPQLPPGDSCAHCNAPLLKATPPRAPVGRERSRKETGCACRRPLGVHSGTSRSAAPGERGLLATGEKARGRSWKLEVLKAARGIPSAGSNDPSRSPHPKTKHVKELRRFVKPLDRNPVPKSVREYNYLLN